MIELSLLILSTTLFSASAESVSDYYDPYAPIFTDKSVYSWTDKVKITIIAPSWNSNNNSIDSIGTEEGHFIKISTIKHSLEPYKLTETEPDSGIFTGEVTLTGFLHDVDGDNKIDTSPRTTGNGPTNGFLETDRDGGITISFEFADGVMLTHSAMISWNIAEISFLKSEYLVAEQAKIQVIEPDLNLNPEAIDQVIFELSSDSDSAGIAVEAIETSEASGIFEAFVLFTQNLASSGTRLFAMPGDMLYAKYDDFTLPSPYSKSDSLDIIDTSKLVSEIPSMERISITDTFLSDNLGNKINEPTINQQLQIVGVIENNQNYLQPFVFLIQIKDERGSVIYLSWVQGNLSSQQILQLSQSWFPEVQGKYTVEFFVWDSLTDPIPLSVSLGSPYFVQ